MDKVREATQLLVKELNAYAAKNGLGPHKLMLALAQAEQALAEPAPASGLSEETASLIERGGLCLGFCDRKWKWVTFTDISALHFSRRSDAVRFIETMREQLGLEDVLVNEHLWSNALLGAAPPASGLSEEQVISALNATSYEPGDFAPECGSHSSTWVKRFTIALNALGAAPPASEGEDLLYYDGPHGKPGNL